MRKTIRSSDPAFTKVGPKRLLVEKIDQTHALHVLAPGQVVYAVQFPDGVVKIGCSGDLAHRHRRFRGSGGEIIGFMPGEVEDEQRIHALLKPHRARGWEYYHPTPPVMAVVNEMRDRFGLPHIAA